jgi:hypothetical protein
MVFTIPEQLAPLALRNQRLFYSLLFRAASETLLEIAADPRHLGARIGVLAVLHTWSQNLQHHPHLHGVGSTSLTGLLGYRKSARKAEFIMIVEEKTPGVSAAGKKAGVST